MKSHQTLIGCGFIAVLTSILYVQTLQFEFLNWDDPLYITDNLQVLQGLGFSGISWAFTNLEAYNWHPLTWLSHMLDVSLFGLNPAGHHAVSVIIHIANSCLLFVFLLRAAGEYAPAMIVALFFALHPTHIESVAWVSERKDVLSTFFLLLAMITYISEMPSLKKHVLVFLLIGCGLMSKPMLVSAPFVLLALDIWPRRKIDARLNGLKAQLLNKIPLFILVVGISMLTLQAQSVIQVIPLETRLENAIVSYLSYLKSLFAPTSLAAFYPYRVDISLSEILFALIVLVGISIFALTQMKQRPYLMAGWALFVITLGPVIGIVQVGIQSHADRYLYIPSIGIFIAAACWYWNATSGLAKHWRLAIPLVLLAAHSIQSFSYLGTWRNSVSLWHNALVVTDPGYRAFIESDSNVMMIEGKPRGLMVTYANMANALLDAGLVDDAIMHFDIAVGLVPDDVVLRRKYAEAMFFADRLERCREQLHAILRLAPDDAKATTMLNAVNSLM